MVCFFLWQACWTTGAWRHWIGRAASAASPMPPSTAASRLLSLVRPSATSSLPGRVTGPWPLRGVSRMKCFVVAAVVASAASPTPPSTAALRLLSRARPSATSSLPGRATRPWPSRGVSRIKCFVEAVVASAALPTPPSMVASRLLSRVRPSATSSPLGRATGPWPSRAVSRRMTCCWSCCCCCYCGCCCC